MSNSKCDRIDEEGDGSIGKKMYVVMDLFQMKLLVPSKTTVIECFFFADHEISDMKYQLIQFC